MNNKRSNRQKDILFILISSFVVVVAWISFNIYHIWVTSTIPSTVQAQLEPIDGSFDASVRQQLQKREQVNPLYDKQAAPDKQKTTEETPITVPSNATTNNASNAAESTQPVTQSIGLQGQ